MLDFCKILHNTILKGITMNINKPLKNTTKKAGCFLVDEKTMNIGLIFRDHLNDYSFPKGHVEPGETFKETAVRETAEETKRDCVIIDEIPEIVEFYTTPQNENCETHMFVARDIGHSSNDSLDVHELVWTPIDEVKNILSYPNLRKSWKIVCEQIKNYFKKK